MTTKLGLWSLICIFVMLLCHMLWGFDNDDAFITYRYARNLANGNGLVYNAGERLLGTTAPLFALILGFFSLIYSNPVFWGKLLSGVCLGIVGIEVDVLLRKAGLSPWSAVAGAMVALLDPLLLSGGFGSETFLHLALILGAFCFIDRERDILPGILLGLAMLSRGDGAVALVIYFLIVIWIRKKIPWKSLLAGGVVILPWVLWSAWYFGSPLPETLQVKRLQAIEWNTFFLQGLSFYAKRYMSYTPLIIVSVPLALMGVFSAIRKKAWTVLAVVIWGAAYLLSYAVLNVPYIYIWYYSIVSPVFVLLAIYGIQWGWGFRDMPGWWKPVAVVLIAITAYSFVRCDVHFLRWLPYPRHPVYREAGEWIRDTTHDSVSVAAFEVGAIGYYSERRIVDLWGLVTRDVARKSLKEGDETWAIRRYRPDILIFQSDRWGNELSIEQAPWFSRAYEFDRTFRSERFPGIDLFRLVNPAAIPGIT